MPADRRRDQLQEVDHAVFLPGHWVPHPPGWGVRKEKASGNRPTLAGGLLVLAKLWPVKSWDYNKRMIVTGTFTSVLSNSLHSTPSPTLSRVSLGPGGKRIAYAINKN